MSPCLPAADALLAVGIRRALDHINAGDLAGARRSLEVALSAAELNAGPDYPLDDEGDDRLTEHDAEDLLTSQ